MIGHVRADTTLAFLLCIVAAAPSPAAAATAKRYVRVYLDDNGNVHAVTSQGKDLRLTQGRPYRDPKLAPDQRTVGAQHISRIKIDRGVSDEEVEVAEELWIYRDGAFVRRVIPDGFIRDWSFWNGGKEVVIYSGALHFAGFYVLYDLSSGKLLKRSQDPVTAQSPDWVRGFNHMIGRRR